MRQPWTTYMCMITFLLILISIQSQDTDGSYSDINEEYEHEQKEEQDFNIENEQNEFNLLVQQTLQELNLTEKDSLTKSEFEKVFHFLMSKDEGVEYEYKDVYNKLRDKLIQDIPETFPLKDTVKYMDLKKISLMLSELLAGQQENSTLLETESEDVEEEEEFEEELSDIRDNKEQRYDL